MMKTSITMNIMAVATLLIFTVLVNCGKRPWNPRQPIPSPWQSGATTVTLSDDGSTLTVNGKGRMADDTAPWKIPYQQCPQVCPQPITTVIIEEGVTHIGENAFNHKYMGIKSIIIPTSVRSIGNNAFAGSTSLTKIDVANDNANYTSEDGVLFNKRKTKLIQYPAGKQGAYTIPNSVTTIRNDAFAYCTSLTSVIIPERVTKIGHWAFYECINLRFVISRNPKPPKIDRRAFPYQLTQNNVCLYVPANSINAYRSNRGWGIDKWGRFRCISDFASTPKVDLP